MPCKQKMAGCRINCLHKQMVENYRLARAADELKEEKATLGYATEIKERRKTIKPITFKTWLTGKN
jgi:hypothetical protein